MIACVVPTIRPECWDSFVIAWQQEFLRHKVELIKVQDGDSPYVEHNDKKHYVKDIMGSESDLIYNKSDCVRNLGFAYVAKHLKEADLILTFDDDVLPLDETIAMHSYMLNRKVPTSWISTMINDYPRGFPYALRGESEVVLSHGVWEGVKDWDAPTQLTRGNPEAVFYQGPIPKGVHFPMCGMNVMFKRKLLPYMYYAPMGYRVGMDRFADIWLGVVVKRVIDENNWAAVTGYSKVWHDRASNVWANLRKEAPGLELNESFWMGVEEDDYFKEYAEARKRWEGFICQFI